MRFLVKKIFFISNQCATNMLTSPLIEHNPPRKL